MNTDEVNAIVNPSKLTIEVLLFFNRFLKLIFIELIIVLVYNINALSFSLFVNTRSHSYRNASTGFRVAARQLCQIPIFSTRISDKINELNCLCCCCNGCFCSCARIVPQVQLADNVCYHEIKFMD